MDEAKNVASKVETMIPDADANKFNWELTDRDQGNFDVKMMTFLWFHDGVTPHDRKRVQPDLQQALVRTPAMRDNAGLTKEQFDMKWVST